MAIPEATTRPVSVTRRRALFAAPLSMLLAATAGCTQDDAPAPAVDPDRAALEAALDLEVLVQQAVDSWTDATPLLRAEAVAVSELHVQTLLDALGGGQSDPTPSPSSTPSSVRSAELLELLDDTVDAHSRSLRTASAAVSPLLASLAASDAALAAAVRRSRM